jgi:hypothetical protein
MMKTKETLLERIQETTAELDALIAKAWELMVDTDKDPTDFEISEKDAWAGAIFQFMFQAKGKPPRMLLHIAGKLDLLETAFMLDQMFGGVAQAIGEHANCTPGHCTVTGEAHDDWPEEIGTEGK